jgi:deazaflavin-dependent oxidoreductase (nitroreductase family)
VTAPLERPESERPRWQRTIVAIVSSGRGAPWARRLLYRIDRPLLRLTRGRLAITSSYPVLLLTTTGAKTGEPRTMPLFYVRIDGGIAIIGTRFGGTRHPGWYHNLRAHPEAMVEIDGLRSAWAARDADAAERAEIWSRAVRMYSGYERYAARAHRRIPIVVLTPIAETGAGTRAA